MHDKHLCQVPDCPICTHKTAVLLEVTASVTSHTPPC